LEPLRNLTYIIPADHYHDDHAATTMMNERPEVVEMTMMQTQRPTIAAAVVAALDTQEVDIAMGHILDDRGVFDIDDSEEDGSVEDNDDDDDDGSRRDGEGERVVIVHSTVEVKVPPGPLGVLLDSGIKDFAVVQGSEWCDNLDRYILCDVDIYFVTRVYTATDGRERSGGSIGIGQTGHVHDRHSQWRRRYKHIADAAGARDSVFGYIGSKRKDDSICDIQTSLVGGQEVIT
jgi:hypothetical protein